MAVLKVACPRCATGYMIDETLRGKKGKCKKCGTAFVLGDASTGNPAAVPTPAPATPAPKEANTAKDRPRGEDGVPLIWEPGDDILGQYEVRKFSDKKPFIEGGMGRVNRVWHKAWQRDLVVKNIKPPRPPAVLRPSVVENFLREAEVWVDKLGLHPNIVCCHYVRVLGGLPRVFVEYVDGGDLATWIRSGKIYEGGPRRALERILDIAIQLTWGLHYTHEQGLVHQDVKPRNVMMTQDGIAKVTDFGLARARAVAESGDEEVPLRSDVTGLPGTRSYQSPEQAAGKRLTPASDLWSWGVSLWHMFLGEVECGLGADALNNLNHFMAAQDRDDRCPEMPPRLVELLRSCFEHEPEARSRSMLEVADALQSIYQQATGQPYPREKPNAAEALADTLNNRAVSLFDLDKKAEAEQKWQEALRVDPQHPEATYNWGLIQWRSARITDLKLLERLREARASSADSARVDYLIGLVHLERTDAQAAVDLLRKAVEAGTRRAEITSALALAQSLCAPFEHLSIFGGDAAEGHTGLVRSVSWSPDGRYVLSGGEDKTLRLWKVSSGQCLRTFQGHTDGVYSVSWSPDGHYALSGSGDQTLRRWEVSSGKCLRTFQGHTNIVTSVSWSPDGRYALSGSVDKTLRLWEVSSGKCLRIFQGHTYDVTSVSWSADGRYALSGETADSLTGSDENTLRLWEVSSGRCLRTFQEHTHRVCSVSWSPDGRYALSGGVVLAEGEVCLWGIAFAKQLIPLITSMAFAASSTLYHQFLRQVRDTIARNPAAAARLLQQARQQPGCSRREETLELARLLSRSLAHSSFVEGWAKRTFQGHTDDVGSVSWSPDGRHVLSGGWDKTLRLWEVSSGRCLRTFQEHTHRVCSVSWSPDGRYALSGSSDKTLRLWEVSSGKCLRTFCGDTGMVSSVSWSPDGRYALSGSNDETLRFWEVSSGQCLRTSQGHTNMVTSVSWSPDGRYALSGSARICLEESDDHTLRLWEVSSGQCLRTFQGHTDDVGSVSWSPDGRYALSGSGDQTLRLWEVSSGKCLRTFCAHTGTVTSVSWSPDGRYALSGSSDKTLRLWEVSSGNCLRIFQGHTGGVKSLSWSPDGCYALSGSSDKTLRLWELYWEFEANHPADWDEGARPFLAAFLTIHPPGRASWFRRAKRSWAEDDFRRLLERLGCAGFGWLRPEGVRRELESMAATWQGPPPLIS